MDALASGNRERVVGGWGGKKVSLLIDEVVIKHSVSGYRTAGWLWWHGPIALTERRLIWTPGLGDALFVDPVVISLSEIHVVSRHSMNAIDWLVGGGPHWIVQTLARNFTFAFGGKGMNNDNPDDWIEAIRKWARAS